MQNGRNIYPDLPIWHHMVNLEGGIFVAATNVTSGLVESWALDTNSFVWQHFGVAPAAPFAAVRACAVAAMTAPDPAPH